jgi:hypothetical protein
MSFRPEKDRKKGQRPEKEDRKKGQTGRRTGKRDNASYSLSTPHGIPWPGCHVVSPPLSESGGVNWCQAVPVVAAWHDVAKDYQISCGEVAVWRTDTLAAASKGTIREEPTTERNSFVDSRSALIVVILKR